MFEQWCQNAYLNGIKELYESRNRKGHFVFWSFTLFVMGGFSLYFVGNVVRQYVSSPTVTTIATYPSTTLEMPEIMLCFNGGLNTSALFEAKLSKDLILVLHGALTAGTYHFKNLTSVNEELKSYLRINNLTVDKLYEKFSYDCTDMVEYFYDAGTDRMFNNKACDPVMASTVWTTFGRCIIYRNNLQQHWPGLAGGVRMYLKFPPNSLAEYFSTESLLIDKSMSYAISLEKSFDIQTERFVLASANAKTEIVLNTKRYVRMPGGKIKCDPQNNNGAMFNLCFGKCFADAVLKSCGCIPFKYYHPASHKGKIICTPFEEIACNTFLQYSIPCEQTCKPACDEWVFETTISYGSGHRRNDASDLRSSVWIGYHTLQYTEISEVTAFSIQDAIANVGAQVGLWLGCSLVTIVQAVYYIYMAYFGERKDKVRKISIKTGTLFDEDQYRRETKQTF